MYSSGLLGTGIRLMLWFRSLFLMNQMMKLTLIVPGMIFAKFVGVSSDYAQPSQARLLKKPAHWLAEHRLGLLRARDRK